MLTRFARPKGAKDKKKRKSRLLRNIAMGVGGAALLGGGAYLGRGKIAGLMGKKKPGFSKVEDPWSTPEKYGSVATASSKSENLQKSGAKVISGRQTLALPSAGESSARVRKRNTTEPIPEGQLSEQKIRQSMETAIERQPYRKRFYNSGGTKGSDGYYSNPYERGTKKAANWERTLEKRERLGLKASMIGQMQPTVANRKLRRVMAASVKERANADKLRQAKNRVLGQNDELDLARISANRTRRSRRKAEREGASQEIIDQKVKEARAAQDNWKRELAKNGPIRRYKTTGRKKETFSPFPVPGNYLSGLRLTNFRQHKSTMMSLASFNRKWK